jgi:uncharacterized membrane protein
MRSAQPAYDTVNDVAPPHSHKFSWAVFLVLLLAAALFINQTVAALPARVAVHFDANGVASSFMTGVQYRRFILLFTIGTPIVLVAFMSSAYSRATDMKLPNRDYWLAPQRIARTRSFLVAHGIWFGSLLVALMSFVHWLVLDANRRQPPALSNQGTFLGLLVLLVCMAAWIGTLMVAFRRPPTSA